MKTIYDFTVTDNKGKEVSLEAYRGKVLLVVNTATRCGFTPQYEGLEMLYEKFAPQGFEILDFPCNQFAFQAPGSDEKIESFCTLRFHTTFPRFSKINVNGRKEAPLYTFLKSQAPGRIGWNFVKFLIGKDGTVKGRFASNEKPDDLEEAIQKELSR